MDTIDAGSSGMEPGRAASDPGTAAPNDDAGKAPLELADASGDAPLGSADASGDAPLGLADASGIAPLGLSGLVAHLADRARGRRRFVVGLAGPPGSGKSTVAAHLAAALGGVVVPMDGFHLDNDELDRLGRRGIKGAPETFDADGFVRLVERLTHPDDTIAAPSFDRVADCTIDDAISVTPDDHVVIVEGNYLLLDRPPWASLRELFDRTAYLDVDDTTRIERLVARHVQHGRTPEDADEFVRTSDEANAAIIARSRPRADVVINASRP